MLIQPIDYLLVGWFVLAALTSAYVAFDQFANIPETSVMKWGVHPCDALYGTPLTAALCPRRQGAPSWRARTVYRATLETGCGQYDSLCCRRRDRNHSRGGHHCVLRPTDVDSEPPPG